MLPRFTAGHVHRPRLVARIAEAPAAIVIHAPSGYGKSLLLAEWAAHADGERLIVLQASTETTTRRAFWTALFDAAISGLELPTDHPITTARPYAGDGAAFRASLPRLFAGLPTPIALVVDGFEHVTEAEEVVADLQELVRYLPGCRLVLATRRWTPLQDALTALVIDVETIGPEELCFTTEETRRCLGERAPAALDLVQRVTGGVPLLVRLSALERELSGRETTDERRLEERIVAHFRAVMERTSGASASAGLEVEDALLAVCAADLLDAALAERLSGAPGEAILDQIERLGLGTVMELPVLDGRRTVLQVPRPLLAILRDIARRRDEPGYRSARREFGTWARVHGLWVEALSAAIDSADFAFVSEILLENWADFLAIHAGVISSALEGVDPATLRRWPALAAALAIDCFWQPEQQPRIRAYLAAAAAGIRDRSATASPEERFVYAVIGIIATRLGAPEEGDGREYAARALEALRALDAVQRGRLRGVLPDAINQIAGTLLFFGDPVAALEVLRLQRPDGASSDGARFRYLSLSLQAEAEAFVGDMVAATRTIDRAVEDFDARFANRGFVVSPILLAETLRDLERGEYAAAAEGLRRADFDRPEVESWYLYWELAAWAAIATGSAGDAFAALQRRRDDLRRRRDISAYATAHLDRTAARLALASGEPAIAQELLRGIDPLGVVEAGIARAQAHLLTGRVDQVTAQLTAARAGIGLTPRLESLIALLGAAALLESGERDSARWILTRVSATLAAHGMTLPLVALGERAGRAVIELGRQERIAFFTRLPVEVEEGVARSFPPIVVPDLTPRERQVLDALLLHSSYQEIADALHVSKDTVKTQLRSVYRKLGVNSREAAIAAVMAIGLPFP